VIGHLAGDVLTPAGVRPLWPFSRRRYALSLWRSDSRVANYGLLGAGLLVTIALVVTVR